MKTIGYRFPNIPIRILATLLFYVLATSGASAQISLSTTTAQNENFDGIGTAATASLPANFRVDKPGTVRSVGSFGSALTATTFAAGANLSGTATNGIYNFGAGTTTTGPDRAIGFLSSGSATQSGNLYAQYANNTGDALTGLQISYDVEKYRGGSNSAGFRIQLYYSFDGTSWTIAPISGFTTTFVADGSNSGYSPAPGATVSVTNQILSVPIPNGSSFYLAWNYSVTSGSTTTNAQALAIDNISVLGIGTSPPPTNPIATGSGSPATVSVGGATLLTVSVTPGANPTSTGILVTADLSSVGGLSSQQFLDDGLNGDAVAGDNIFSYSATIAPNTSPGLKSLPITVIDAQTRSVNSTIALTVLGPTPPTASGIANPASVSPGGSTFFTVSVTPGSNPPSTGISVVCDLSSIGGSSSQQFFDDGTNGDLTPNDNIFSYSAIVATTASGGSKSLPVNVTDGQSRTASTTIALTVQVPAVPPGSVVISQFYGGGGNANAILKNDFIELYNRTTGPITLDGWTVQYASATGTSWQTTSLSGTIQPGHYYLIQEAAGATGTVSLPTSDAIGAINMSATAGKVALVSNSAALGASCPPNASIVDFVGFGTNASCFEGSAKAPAPSNTTALLRRQGGCIDTDNNSADFFAGTPNPRNSASPANDCTITPPISLMIDEIQGSGSTSPHVGQNVTTNIAIVTGLKSNGFFIQTPDNTGDNDPSTSEGIFVFTGSPRPSVPVIGDAVTVTGTVSEFIPSSDPNSPPMTEISGFPTVSVISSGNPLPNPIVLDASATNPAGSIEQLERYEGMRVSVSSLTVVGPTEGNVNETNATSTSTGIFYGVITGVARPFREAGVEVPDPLPAGSPANVTRFDANPERLRIDSDGQPGALRLDVAAGQVVMNLVGPLDYGSRTYTILPDVATPPSVSGPSSAIPVPVAGANQLTVASFNTERFFDTVDDPGISDVALTPTAFSNRLNKISLAIRNVLRSPDIIGVEEMENLTTLQAVATKVNNDAVAAGQPNPNYQAYLQEGNDVGGIDVGLLVKTPRVTVIDVTQVGKDATYVDPTTTQPDLLNDRPPLVLRATVQPLAGAPFAITVIVNHLRSLSGIDDPVDGNRVRTKRRAQAEFLANYIQARQTADPNEHIISVGDFNAFQLSDGYVDVMGTIKGTPTPSDQVVLAGADLVNPDLIDLVDTAPPDQRYSYVFGGNAQELDHVLITSNLQALSAGISWGRNDADFPEVFRNDATRPERISDHDPMVAYFNIPAGTHTLVTSATNGTVSKNPDQLTYNHGTVVQLTATPAAGYHFVDWTGDATGSTNPLSVTMDANKTITANFSINTYTLAVTALNGSVGKNPDQPNYNYGTAVQLAATAAAGYHFVDWTGDATGSTNPLSMTMDANKAITANFAINTYSLAVTALNGSVAKSPDQPNYNFGTAVQLTAAPATGYHFVDWTGDVTGSTNPLSITMDANKTITANFAINTYTLAVTALNGSVAKNPDQPTYNSGTAVQMTATPAAGYHFVNWTGDATGSTNPLTLTMDANKTISANFAINTYTLAVTAVNGSVAKNPDQPIYNSGTPVQLLAVPAPCYRFVSWGGDANGSANPITITMNADKNVSANFVANAPPVVGTIAAPSDPVAVNTEINVSTTFTDPDPNDVHTATWNWGDGTTAAGVVSNPGTVSGKHTFTSAGLYTLQVTVSDGCGAQSTTSFSFVVVTNPAGGFTVGGAWISSPAGAYIKNLSYTGKGYFAFVATYLRNNSLPLGATSFQLKPGLLGSPVLSFTSASYQWLVISGARAEYKGVGKIGGTGNYGFFVSVTNGTASGADKKDRFRIKIWDKSNGDATVYDSQQGAADDATPTIAIDGGLIAVYNSGSGSNYLSVNTPSIQKVVEEESAIEIPTEYALYNAYPNPFNPSTTITFDLPEAVVIRLVVYDMLGREVALLAAEERPAGQHTVKFDAGHLPSGMYIYRLQAGKFVQSKKFMLLK